MKLNKSTGIFVRVAAVAFAVFCVVSVVKIELEYNELKDRKKMLEEQVEEYERAVEKKKAELETPFDEEYIIRIAKQKLNLRLPEEIIFYNNYRK